MDSRTREGIRLYHQGFYERALDSFLSSDVDPMEEYELAYYMGLAYIQLDHLDEAEEYLHHVVSLDYNMVRLYQVRMLLAYIYARQDKNRDAQIQLDSLVDAGYESVQVYSIYGYTCWQAGDEDKAFEYLRKAVLMDAENPTALNSLGYLLAEENREIDNALRYCRKAVSHQPDNALYLDSLAWAYHRNGEEEEAYALLRKAVTLDPENREIQGHLKEVMKHRTGGRV